MSSFILQAWVLCDDCHTNGRYTLEPEHFRRFIDLRGGSELGFVVDCMGCPRRLEVKVGIAL
jgi:hypothetical protein